jgi:uncharacterized protein YjbJ (UPF0337 family)
MINEQTLQGNWQEIKGAIKQHWAALGGDDLTFDGNVNRLVDLIQSKTGASRDSIQRFLENLTTEGSAVLGSAAQVATEFADRAVEAARDSYGQFSSGLRDRYADSAEMIRKRPGGSVATAFGAGMVAGIILLLMLRTK